MSSTCPSEESVPNALTEAATRPVLVPRVLILDDQAEGWAPITRAIRQRGLGVLVSGVNDSALELVTCCDAEVVILELRSPARDGLDFMKRLRAASPETELILTTGEASLEETSEAFREGAFDVVRRPFAPMELGPAIVRAMDKRKKRREAAALLREGQRLLSIRERERLPVMAVEFAQRAMRADVVSLMLRDASGHLYVAHGQGLPDEVLSAGARSALGQRVAARVVELRAPVVVDEDLFRDERAQDLVPFGRVCSSLVYPLMTSERVIGVLSLGRSAADQPFGAADLERAGVVASQIVLAFETLKQWQRSGMSERLAIVNQVVASVTHEINNPLAAVVGQNDLALESVDEVLSRLTSGAAPDADDLRVALSEIRGCLEEAQGAAATLQAVARDLRAAVHKGCPQEQRFEVGDAVRSAIRLATSEVRKQTEITLDVEPRLSVVGDPGLLSQVFLNLILNANQALHATETPAPAIRIIAKRVGAEVRVDVVDNGPGLAPEDLARIFEPFSPSKNVYTRSGLGLSIASDIVQGLGGRLEVSAHREDGSSFSVCLPAPSFVTSDAPSSAPRGVPC